jgi:hypothetical protein
MRIEPDAYGIAASEFISELFQDGDIINVDDHPQFLSLNDLGKVYTVGSEKDPVWGEAGLQPKLYFIDGDAIQSRPQALDVFQDVDITEGLAGIKEPGIRKGSCQDLVLALDLFRMIYIQGGTKFISQLNEPVI